MENDDYGTANVLGYFGLVLIALAAVFLLAIWYAVATHGAT